MKHVFFLEQRFSSVDESRANVFLIVYRITPPSSVSNLIMALQFEIVFLPHEKDPDSEMVGQTRRFY